MKKACVTLIVIALAAPAARAQEPGQDLDANARLRVGPLSLTPTLSLTNLGVDDNVFDRPDADHPTSDFTMTVTPATDLWLRMGRTWIVGNVKEDLVYFDQFASERSANTSAKAGWMAPFNHLRLQVDGQFMNTRERPGFEIDARARRLEYAGSAAVEARLFSRTFVGGRGERRKVDFAQQAAFQGIDLHEELTRTTTTAAMTARHELTPLTSLIFEAGMQQDRFPYTSFRDTDSTRYTGGVRFEPFALVNGSATIGYRDFRPRTPEVPSYRGLTSDVSLSYTALGTTRLVGNFLRDVQYSYDINQPFYLQTGGSLMAQQQIYGPFDVVGRVGLQRLDYVDRIGAAPVAPGRRDSVRLYGGGAGYHVGRDLRVGFNVEQYQRSSALADRRYDTLRFGLSVTYGL